jgi:hypothetical protein
MAAEASSTSDAAGLKTYFTLELARYSAIGSYRCWDRKVDKGRKDWRGQ